MNQVKQERLQSRLGPEIKELRYILNHYVVVKK